MTVHFDLRNNETKNRYIFFKYILFKLQIYIINPSVAKNIRFMPKKL